MMWGVSPCLTVGQHSGVAPKILDMIYERDIRIKPQQGQERRCG